MFTNVSRPSAVDVLRPFAVGDTFYADTTSTLAKLAAGSTGSVYSIAGGIPTWTFNYSVTDLSAATSAGILLQSNNGTDIALMGAGGGAGVTFYGGVVFSSTLSVIDTNFSIIGSSDSTKSIKFEVDAQTANDTLTIDTGAQTDSRTATFPVLTGNSILTLSDTTLTSGRVPYATTNGILTDSASLAWNGTTFAVTGAITASTTITATTRVIGATAPIGVYGVETSAGMASYNTTTDTNGRYAIATRRVANTSASGAHNARAISGELFGTIASGQTNSGTWAGLWYEALRNYVATGDTGTLAVLEGVRVSYGHFNTDASTPSTTTVTGLRLLGYRSTGTMTTMIGLHVDNGSTSITPTTGYGVKVENVGGTTRYAIHTGTGLVSIGDSTDATSSSTGAVQISGGLNATKNILHRQGRGAGVTSTVTAAGTTTLTSSSTEIQTFTGTTTQTVQFPAANLFGAGIAVCFTINNQSTGTVTPTRAGSDTFQGGGTTDPVLAGASTTYRSNGVSVWLKV